MGVGVGGGEMSSLRYDGDELSLMILQTRTGIL